MTSASPWSDWSDTLIEVDTDSGRAVQMLHLGLSQRVRYWAKRLRPAAPTEIVSVFPWAKDVEPAPEFEAATDFAGL